MTRKIVDQGIARSGPLGHSSQARHLDHRAEARKQGPLALGVLHAPPTRVFDGLMAVADGTNWDPGEGQGLYQYYNSTWNKVGRSESDIDHDLLLNFVANEHIDWTGAAANFQNTGTFLSQNAGTFQPQFKSTDNNAVQILLTTNSTNRRVIGRNAAGTAKSQIQFLDDIVRMLSGGGTNQGEFGATGLNTLGLSINSGARLVAVVPKTADEIVNNSTTLQDDNHLFFVGNANKTYLVELIAICESGSTPGFISDFIVGGGGTIYYGSANQGSIVQTSGSLGIGGNNSFRITFKAKAWAYMGGSTGTIQWRWAQSTATVANTTVYKGSVMKVWEIA